jgi:hypothetical protein
MSPSLLESYPLLATAYVATLYAIMLTLAFLQNSILFQNTLPLPKVGMDLWMASVVY